MEVCDDIYNHEDAQIQTQKLVSGIQVISCYESCWNLASACFYMLDE